MLVDGEKVSVIGRDGRGKMLGTAGWHVEFKVKVTLRARLDEFDVVIGQIVSGGRADDVGQRFEQGSKSLARIV